MWKCGTLVAAVALGASPAPLASADPVVLSCEVWGSGGPDNVHLVGYAQGIGDTREAAQADAERDMRSSYGFGPHLGHCAPAI
ncbi:hypothetical protein [Segniliparus rugosus]|uniref:Uncharacterized protein n=1 Tax=Segniliparus rugosus (strain ATCC BAA-974 / DSM 45345 / CCUG 50838 / CIP 108380 / JCM 13579 / CDC 945) TaxID=679197 RepID=U1LMC5_SEGRC|nr:hypothetical protein [Segniliparus rugosus]ERG69121.1 hypothetical protein HMPREF9336_04265 [Segniliparus rugosus ATCC BAA-974]